MIRTLSFTNEATCDACGLVLMYGMNDPDPRERGWRRFTMEGQGWNKPGVDAHMCAACVVVVEDLLRGLRGPQKGGAA